MAIDIEAYLTDIDPDNVCGDFLQGSSEFVALTMAIKGKPESQFSEAEPPNWRDIKKQSEALLSKTIDLDLLIYYLRSLIALEGFSGLQDGLTLIKTLVENRWDFIHPQLDPDDDNDPTERINTLLSLCDHDIILWPLQQTPLIESKALGRFSFRQISVAAGKSTATSNESPINQATIEGAVQDCELEQLQQTFQAISVSLDDINQLENVITDYVGISNAPSFADLRNLLKECKAFLLANIEKKTGNETVVTEEEETSEGGVVTVSSGTTKSTLGVINNNQDVIKTLNQVCDYYLKNEPSSPVPLFVERAIKMVGKSFMDALKEIAPTGMDEAKTILGKQDEENPDNY